MKYLNTIKLNNYFQPSLQDQFYINQYFIPAKGWTDVQMNPVSIAREKEREQFQAYLEIIKDQGGTKVSVNLTGPNCTARSADFGIDELFIYFNPNRSGDR